MLNLKLNKENEKEFFEKYYSLKKTGEDKYIKDMMVVEIYEYYKKMFLNEFHKSFNVGGDIRDYESNYKIEFFNALEGFDISKGNKFSTYLYTKIQKSIQKTNKENNPFSIKEYRLNILNIFKSKIIEEFNKINGIDFEEGDLNNYIDYNNIVGNKKIDFKKIYDEMYEKYSLPVIKYESLIQDIPYMFSIKLDKPRDNDIGDNHSFMEYVNYNSNGYYKIDNINNYLDLYFKLKKIYYNKKYFDIYTKITLMGFKVICSKKDIDFLYNVIKKGGDEIFNILEEKILFPEDTLIKLKKRFGLQSKIKLNT